MSPPPDTETEADLPPDAPTFAGEGVQVVKRFDPDLGNKHPAIIYGILLKVDEPREVVIEDPSPAHVNREEQVVGHLPDQEQFWSRNEEHGFMRFKRTISADQKQSYAVLGVKEDSLGPELVDVTPTIRVNGEPISEVTAAADTENSAPAAPGAGSQSGAPAAPGVDQSEATDRAATNQHSETPANEQSQDQTSAHPQDRKESAANGATPPAGSAAPAATSESAAGDTPSSQQNAPSREEAPDESALDTSRIDPQAAADVEASADRAERAAEEAREAASVAENATDAAIKATEEVEALAGEVDGGGGGSLLEQLTDELAEADDEQVAAFRQQLGLDAVAGLSNSDVARVDYLATKVSEMEAYIEKMEVFINENGTAEEIFRSVQDKQTALEADIDEIEDEVEQDLAELEADLDNLRDTVAEVNEEIKTFQQVRDVLGTDGNQ